MSMIKASSSPAPTTALGVATRGLWFENPVLVQTLGLCSALAVTNAVANSLAMGLATTFVLVGASIVVSSESESALATCAQTRPPTPPAVAALPIMTAAATSNATRRLRRTRAGRVDILRSMIFSGAGSGGASAGRRCEGTSSSSLMKSSSAKSSRTTRSKRHVSHRAR